MTVGGFIYDPQLLQKGADFFSLGIAVTRETTLRLPIYLTLLTSLLTLWITLQMREVEGEKNRELLKSVIRSGSRFVWYGRPGVGYSELLSCWD